MKKNIWIIVAVLLVAVVSAVQYAKHQNAPAHVIKVGVSLPLTGPLAEYGEAFRNGITLAQEQSGNTSVQYIFEDDAYEVPKAIAAYNKLTGLDNVDVFVNWGGVATEAVAPLVKGKRLPYISGTFMAHVTETSPYTIRLYNSPDDFAIRMWSYLRAKNYKSVAIIKTESQYPNVVLDSLKRTKNPDETITVVDTYPSTDSKDFHTSILKIKQGAHTYDALGVLLFAGQIGEFYRQAGVLGLQMPTFGTDFFESQSDIDVAGRAITGAVFANYAVSEQFQSAYAERFGNVSQVSYAGSAYDMARMLATITSTDRDAILATLKHVKNFEGAMGTYNYTETADNSDRYFSSPVRMKVIENGKIRVID